jgi:acyl-CoA thioester hydrolase
MTASPAPPADPCAFRAFQWPLRVYWEDTDAGGVVFYANYLKFFERARTEWLRALGVGQQALRADTGTIFIVSQTALRYLAPARLDDRLSVSVQVRSAGRASMTLFQQAWKLPPEAAPPGQAATTTPPLLLAEGSIRVGCVDAGTFRPVRIPTAVLSVLTPSPAPACPAPTRRPAHDEHP